MAKVDEQAPAAADETIEVVDEDMPAAADETMEVADEDAPKMEVHGQAS